MYAELTEDKRCVDERPIGDWKRDARQPMLVGRRWFLHAVLGGTAGLAAWEVAQAVCRPGVAVLACLVGGLFLGRKRIARALAEKSN